MLPAGNISLTFVKTDAATGVIRVGGVRIGVSNQHGDAGLIDTSRRLLSGERGLANESVSTISIKDDVFFLRGLPTADITVEICYSENKAEIDAFLAFLQEPYRAKDDVDQEAISWRLMNLPLDSSAFWKCLGEALWSALPRVGQRG